MQQITNTLSTTYTCTPRPTEADAHARGPAQTYLFFSVLNAPAPVPLGRAWHPDPQHQEHREHREGFAGQPRPEEECFSAGGRGGPAHPGGSGARRPGRLSSRPGNIWTELGGAGTQAERGLAEREEGGGVWARGGAHWPL